MRHLLQNSEIRARLTESKHSLDQIKKQALFYDKKVDTLFDDTIQRIATLLLSNPDVDYSYLIEDFKRKLKDLLSENIDFSVEVASKQANSNGFPILYWNNKDHYDNTIDRYSNLIKKEILYFLGLEFGIFLLKEYMNNPSYFIISNGKSLSKFNNTVKSGQGISYNVKKNLKKLGFSALMLSYNETLSDFWKKNDIWGYMGVRQSNSPCQICDDQQYVPMPIETMVYPLHNNCVCAVVYLRQEEVR